MKSDIPEPTFLSVPEAAKVCGVSRNTVYMWVRNGKLSAYQTPGKTNLIRPGHLVDFMKNSGMFVPPSLLDLAKEDERLMKETEESVTKTDSMCSILIVDDDPMSRSLAVRALQQIGQTYQAETGYEALHILTKHDDISVILLDLRMPGQSGVETLREIQRTHENVNVIIVSGFAQDLPEDLKNSTLVKQILEKPVTVEALQEAVADVNENL